MSKLKRIRRAILLHLLNLFSGSHFFALKRRLLIAAGIPCGPASRVVGPVHLGTVAEVSIGESVWVGADLTVFGSGGVRIGDHVDLGPEVMFLTSSHELNDSPAHRAGKGISWHITVEDGSWIGARAVIQGDVVVGRGAVVGACALVNRSLGDNVLCVGVPAAVKRRL